MPGKSRQEDDDCRHGDFSSLFGAQTLFVREINVIGCKKSITESSIRECLRGRRSLRRQQKEFRLRRHEHRLFKEFDNIVWAKVRHEGNYVEVKISESKTGSSDKVGKETPCNIAKQTKTATLKEFVLHGQKCRR